MVAMRAPGWAAPSRRLEVGDEAVGRARRRVAAVEQRVDDDVLDAGLARASSAIATAWRSVRSGRRPARRGRRDAGARRAAAARRTAAHAAPALSDERAIRDRGVDARQVLEHRPAGAEVEVADLAVAHLADAAARPPGPTPRAGSAASRRAARASAASRAAAMASTAGSGPMPKPSMTTSTIGPRSARTVSSPRVASARPALGGCRRRPPRSGRRGRRCRPSRRP